VRPLLTAALVALTGTVYAAPATDPPPPHAPAHAAAAKPAPAPSAQRQKELQAEQHELKARLAQLKKSLAATESAHTEAADALAASESAISLMNRHLQQLAAARHQTERRIAELEAEQREALDAQNAHASRLGQTLRSQALLRQTAPLADLFDPAQALRDRRDALYLDPVVHARMRRIGELDDRRNALAAREAESLQRSAELARIDADERSSRASLEQQQAARRAMLARLARDIAAQRQSVATLERDDARLAGLIDQIGKVLAEQARRRAEQLARARKSTPGTVPEKSTATAGGHFEPPSATQFGQLRGKLQLPVQGVIGSRFGAPRLGEDGQPQAGAPAWKGLFLRAPAGSPVHAVAAGRVVFADWLRGFGNLLILDHGEGFLSVYAYNETLLHGVGDEVASDELVASVGNTGGNSQSGLYFEMRYQGRPFDPLGWAVGR